MRRQILRFCVDVGGQGLGGVVVLAGQQSSGRENGVGPGSWPVDGIGPRAGPKPRPGNTDRRSIEFDVRDFDKSKVGRPTEEVGTIQTRRLIFLESSAVSPPEHQHGNGTTRVGKPLFSSSAHSYTCNSTKPISNTQATPVEAEPTTTSIIQILCPSPETLRGYIPVPGS
jgi:hypothetical protein